MITDTIQNTGEYSVIPTDVRNFIRNLTPDIPVGRLQINDTDYANIEVYKTKPHERCFFEAHKNCIDIQILLQGEELLEYADINCLEVKDPYNADRDIIFFQNPDYSTGCVKLVPGMFVYLDPNDAHKPQMKTAGVSKQVKKVVVKIRV